MYSPPADRPCRFDICDSVIHKHRAQLRISDHDFCMPEKPWIRLRRAYLCGIDDPIERPTQAQLVHKIAGAQMFLIGGQKNFDPLSSKVTAAFQYGHIQTRIHCKPVINQLASRHRRIQLSEAFHHDRHKIAPARDDTFPMIFEEDIFQRVGRNTQVAFKSGAPMRPIRRPPRDDNPIHIQHHTAPHRFPLISQQIGPGNLPCKKPPLALCRQAQ